VLQRANVDRVRTILVGHSVQDLQTTLRTLLTLLLTGSAVCLGLVCAAAWFLARRALAPIAAITTTAARIAESADFVDRVRGPARLDEVGRLAATFNTMLNRLEAVHAAQRRFVSDASHELRAPLTTIRGNAELLLLDPATPPDEREDALRDIAAEAARLARLVDDLLALARGDARLHSRPQPVHLHELLCATAHLMADRPDVSQVLLGQTDAATVYADPDRLEQLLIILLDNARKYTPPDGCIDCSLRADDCYATVTVCDTGIGIHPDDLPHIFERFYRADRARTHEPARRGDASFDGHAVPGTGLGLAIARQIVEEANGTIAAESEAGTGTSFIVRFPVYTQRQTGSMAHSTPRLVPPDREATAQT
jgi:signal transduction histidine kinase